MHELSQTSESIGSAENSVYTHCWRFLSVCFHYEISTIVHRQNVETVRAIHTAVRHDPVT
jgi:hypothetical protein